MSPAWLPPDMSALHFLVFLTAFSISIGVVVIINVVMAHLEREAVETEPAAMPVSGAVRPVEAPAKEPARKTRQPVGLAVTHQLARRPTA
jgi:hypothetical protein